MRIACVEGGSEAGFGRTGGVGGMVMVSFAAEARAAAPRNERRDARCILRRCRVGGGLAWLFEVFLSAW